MPAPNATMSAAATSVSGRTIDLVGEPAARGSLIDWAARLQPLRGFPASQSGASCISGGKVVAYLDRKSRDLSVYQRRNALTSAGVV
jgi:hypothetical protein